MLWTLFDLDLARRRSRHVRARTVGTCVATLVAEAGAAVRRRSSEEVARIAGLLSDGQYCVPCLMVLAALDARAVYQAMERLSAAVNIRLLDDRCDRCQRLTKVNTVRVDRGE